MQGRIWRSLAAVAVSLAALGVVAGLAAASSGFQLTVSPKRVAPGGHVTVSTSPRMSCTLTITVAGKKFSHAMKYGTLEITMSRKDVPGRVPVKVVCAGHTAYSAFTVAK